jgi:hypothetical protein
MATQGWFWCRRHAARFASWAAAGGMLLGCAVGSGPSAERGDGSGTKAAVQSAVRSGLGQAEAVPAAPSYATRFFAGHVAEVVRGDDAAAREAFTAVMLGVDQTEPVLAARAAVRVAEMEALAGRRAEAVELLARAAALAGRDREILERVDQIHGGLAAVYGVRSTKVRGPPAGTDIGGVSEAARAAFARAEALLVAYHRTDVRPRIEDPEAGARVRLRAAQSAERAYRGIIDLGEPPATVAAEFRIATLYHDMAIQLGSETPPELEGSALARLRRRLQAKAPGYLRAARAAYRRSLAIEATAASDRWRRAAEQGLATVEVLLRGSD